MTERPLVQRTIKRSVAIEGVGLTSGRRAVIELLPARANSGISFVTSKGIISADLSCLGGSDSSTILQFEGCRVKTVEHLLSCLYGLFIDNVTVKVWGGEIPIGDGSARIFYDAITKAGVYDIEDSVRVAVTISKPIRIKGKNKSISITPSKQLSIKYSLDWHPLIKSSYTYIHKQNNYRDIAYSKTFAESSHIKNLQLKKRIKGVKVGENCIDIDSEIAEKSDEYVKHKILDLLGDLSLLCGLYLEGSIVAVNAGHAMHHELVKGILK